MKHILHWTGNVILFILFFLIIAFLEGDTILAQLIAPPLNVKLEDWVTYFKIVAEGGLVISFFIVSFWYIWGSCLASFKTSNGLAKRLMWWILLAATGIVLLLSIIITRAQEGAWIAYLFYMFNTIIFYYILTVCFSPLTVKYVPLGAKYIRHW